MLMLELSSPPCRRVLRSERCYVVARIDGRVLVGATMERVGFDKTVSAAAVGNLLEAGRQIAPTLATALGGEAWAGLRPATPDGLPAIGYVEDGLVAATGHFRNGILLAPVTAEIVAGLLAGAPPHPAASLLDPTRFTGAAAR
jgi:glycine oxidase